MVRVRWRAGEFAALAFDLDDDNDASSAVLFCGGGLGACCGLSACGGSLATLVLNG